MTNNEVNDYAWQFASALLDGSTDVVALWTQQGAVWFVPTSRSVQELLGLTEDEIRSASLEQVVHAEDLGTVRGAYQRLVAEPSSRQTVRYRARHKAGSYVFLESTAVNRLHDGVTHAIVIHTRETAALENEPSVIDDTDPGGGRMAFIMALDQAVRIKYDMFWRKEPSERATAGEHGYDFTAMVLEIDRYKMLLGTYGDHVINELLNELGTRIRLTIGPEDVVSYLGNGEFGILLRGAASIARVDKLTERLQSLVEELSRAGGRDVATTATIGIATSERAYQRAEEVMSDAAAAITRARRERRSKRAVFRTKMRLEDTAALSMLRELRIAIQEKQFVVHYQPIVTMAKGELAGFEALVRWCHPQRGMVPPGAFLPTAEESGDIMQIGNWVLVEACRQLAEWQQRFAKAQGLTMSVNLSAQQFNRQDVKAIVESALRETGLAPAHLKLEITESAVLDNREAAGQSLSMLKLYGVHFSLDDFGTGYASFSYLLELPFDTIKIDRSFVAAIGSDDPRQTIVQAITTLAHDLKMNVVAEGVETAEHVTALSQMNCDFGQGYYYAKPMDSIAASALLADDAGPLPTTRGQ